MKLNRLWAKVVFRSAKETDERVHVFLCACTYSKSAQMLPRGNQKPRQSIIRFVRGANNDYDGHRLSLRQVRIADTTMSGGEQVVGKMQATRFAGCSINQHGVLVP